jgi:hypothetical protein
MVCLFVSQDLVAKKKEKKKKAPDPDVGSGQKEG